MTMKIRLIKEYDDHEPLVLGVVTTNNSTLHESAARALIHGAWSEFQSTEPDCDSDFPDWLCANHPFEKTADESLDIVL